MVLRRLCDSPRTGCAWRITPLCKWREQAIIEWSRRVISIVACATVRSSAHMPLGISDRNNTQARFLKKYTYGSCLRDVKHGRNPSRNEGHFGLRVLFKLFFWILKNIFRQSVPVVSFNRALRLRFVSPMYLCLHSPHDCAWFNCRFEDSSYTVLLQNSFQGLSQVSSVR